MEFQYKTYKYYLMAFCIAGIAFSGCKKALDIDPPIATITAQKAFSTDSLANSALAGIYSLLMSNNGTENFSNGTSMLYGAMSADELVDYTGSSNTTDYQFVSNKVIASNTIPEAGIWKPAYNIIYNCNQAIEQLSAATSSGVTTKTKTEIIGECKFVRAYCLFYLTNFFGDVPLPLTTNYTTNSKLARVPQTQVYQQIVQDLKDAQSTLQADFSAAGGTGTNRTRANKWAATALLAKVYLYQKDWQNAITQSTAIISNNSQFSLVSSPNNVFLANSIETILQLAQTFPGTAMPFNSTWDAQNVLPLYNWNDVAAALGPFASVYLSDPSLYASFADEVLPKYYMTPQLVSAFETGDTRFADWVQVCPTPNAAPYTGATYYYPYKYTIAVTSRSAPATQYYMVLRLAEQYLIRAEAEAELSITGAAAADINIIRNRAGLPNTTAASQATLLTAVAHERQIELFCEMGNRFFDLKRTGQAATVLGALPAKQPFNSNQLLYPIPLNEITTDPSLKQNPGYTNF